MTRDIGVLDMPSFTISNGQVKTATFLTTPADAELFDAFTFRKRKSKIWCSGNEKGSQNSVLKLRIGKLKNVLFRLGIGE